MIILENSAHSLQAEETLTCALLKALASTLVRLLIALAFFLTLGLGRWNSTTIYTWVALVLLAEALAVASYLLAKDQIRLCLASTLLWHLVMMMNVVLLVWVIDFN